MPRACGRRSHVAEAPASFAAGSAAARGLACCRVCHATSRMPSGGHASCPRCGARLALRLPLAVQRTWALLLTAAICYVPANLYPIMTVVRFGRGQPDTIASGIVHLAEGGQWPIAFLVFVASIVVPVVKIGALALLLVSVQCRWRWRVRERAELYRFVDFIGRWSMIDVFMISILVALVRLGALATIVPGPGAAFFAAVVLATMFAAVTFDERLLWDAADD